MVTKKNRNKANTIQSHAYVRTRSNDIDVDSEIYSNDFRYIVSQRHTNRYRSETKPEPSSISENARNPTRKKKRQIHRTIQIEMLKIKSCLWLLALLGTNNVKKIAASEYVCDAICSFTQSLHVQALKNMDLWHKRYSKRESKKKTLAHIHIHTETQPMGKQK